MTGIPLGQKQINAIIHEEDDGSKGWTSRVEKSGHGDYGRREIFSLHGRDICCVEIDFSQGGKATGYDLREKKGTSG